MWQFTNLHSLFEGSIYLTTKLSILADNNELPCEGGNACQVRYQYTATPQFYDVIPSQVYNDQRVDFIINPQNAQD
jgi:hypothetical protein